MTDNAFEALRANDRPHSLDAVGYQRIEQVMLDAYRDAESEGVGDITVLPIDRPDPPGGGPNRPGLALLVAVAAGIIVLGVTAVRFAGSRGQAAPASGTLLGDYCEEYLDPLADALDLLRVNPNQANAANAHRRLGEALTHLDENAQIDLDIDELTEDHRTYQPSTETAESLIGIANGLGRRIATSTASSSRCDYQRLAPNEDLTTDPIGRPITGD